MKFKDYYQILGVSDSATAEEIKRAYRKLARKYHPDVSEEPDAEEQFKTVNEAYEVLRDAGRRAEFDQIKKHGFRGGDDFQRPSGWQGDWNFNPRAGGGLDNAADYSDFFESIFGRSGFGSGGSAGFDDVFNRGGTRSHHHSKPRHSHSGHSVGNDIHLTVRVSLLNAYRGGKTRIKIPEAPGYPSKALSVTIPAGVVDGQLLRLRGQGRPGARNGDLLLTIQLKPHELFVVDGSNVSLKVPVTPVEAIEGATLEVPTLGGKVSLKVPRGTRSGTQLRIKGRGLPSTPAGDQIAIVQISLPDSVDSEMLDQFREIESSWDFDPRAHFEATEKTDG